MTTEEIEIEKKKIDALTHFEMCRMWRFGTAPAKWQLRSDDGLAEYFTDRLFNHFGGFTPEISKEIGWKL